MKKLSIILLVFMAVFASSCIKNKDIIFEDAVVEIDPAAYNANFVGLTYPILFRIPGQGRATSSGFSDPFINRATGVFLVRINLVGAQRNAPVNVTYRIIPVPVNSSNGFNGSALLNTFNAVAGTHYETLSGTTTIPANSSFGFISVKTINPGVSASEGRLLGIELTGGDVRVSENYKSSAFAIDQR
jgi:hypothetical protein